MKMPSPRTSVESSSTMFGRPDQCGADGVKSTPIVGLESMPIRTRSSPAAACWPITAATSFASRRQWRR